MPVPWWQEPTDLLWTFTSRKHAWVSASSDRLLFGTVQSLELQEVGSSRKWNRQAPTEWETGIYTHSITMAVIWFVLRNPPLDLLSCIVSLSSLQLVLRRKNRFDPRVGQKYRVSRNICHKFWRKIVLKTQIFSPLKQLMFSEMWFLTSFETTSYNFEIPFTK